MNAWAGPVAGERLGVATDHPETSCRRPASTRQSRPPTRLRGEHRPGGVGRSPRPKAFGAHAPVRPSSQKCRVIGHRASDARRASALLRSARVSTCPRLLPNASGNHVRMARRVSRRRSSRQFDAGVPDMRSHLACTGTAPTKWRFTWAKRTTSENVLGDRRRVIGRA